ncbi:DNA-directed RNA polymerase III subunit 2, partial [Ananas comosus]
LSIAERDGFWTRRRFSEMSGSAGEVCRRQISAPAGLPEGVRGLVKQHIDSFNYFINHEMKKIMKANDLLVAHHDPNIYLRYTNIYVESPSVEVDRVSEELKPHFCRLSDRTYAAPVKVDIEYSKANLPNKVEYKRGVLIGRMPIMLRSSHCVLNGKDEEQLARLGECPLDPGGYFIIKGTEKVILIQEQLSKNRIIIDTDSKGRVTASVTSSTHETKSKTVLFMDKEKIYLQLNQFVKPIPILVIMKAMGMESDQEVVQMIGRDPRYGSLLLPSLQECASERIYTQQQALEYLDGKVVYSSSARTETRKESRAKSILLDVFLANVLVKEGKFRPKCIYTAVMLRRMMDAILNTDTFDDKACGFVQNNEFPSFGTAEKVIRTAESLESFGNFPCHMTRISPQFEKTRKWGMLCPCDTPEGEACGLTKNLALMTHVTTDEEEGPLVILCYSLGVQDLSSLSAEEIHTPGSYLVIFNGLILGKHEAPKRFANAMRSLRRSGKIGEFVSIYVNDKQHCVYVASDGGRVCRPLVIADKGVSRIKEHHMKELRDGLRTFDDFLRDGLVEYLDVNEENNALIALYEHELDNDESGAEKDDVKRSSITHIEIEPFTILGVVAGLIPYPHHNQSPRNTYQCAMGKQAMGNIAYNQASRNFLYYFLCRADTLLYLLVYPQRPLLTTKTIELVGYDKLGAGQNATVAVMSYSGYDIEDAIVMNKASLDRGFGRCIAMKRYTVVTESYGPDILDKIVRPRRNVDGSLPQNMQILDEDGLAAPGEIIRNNYVYVNKQTPVDRNISQRGDRKYTDAPVIYKGPEGETIVVDRVILCSDTNDKLTIKFITRHTRRPEVGDKFSSRHGQKGVCGTIVRQEDFPFSERGICPDLIMNPHGFPSRMTIGKMIELLGGKAGVSCGRFHYGSAFGEPSGHADKVEDISKTLVKHGFSYSGKDFLYSGITGYPLQAYIFMGPIYYQKLKHMVLDKIHARAKGPRVTLTRQPTEGRIRHGGLRLGEMERDCLIAYGASMLLFERLMLSSDPYQVQVCRKCGLLGYYNYKLKKSFCSMCKNGENIATMKLPYACKLLFQELQSMNVVPRLTLTEA